MSQDYLKLIAAPATDYRLQDEDRSGVKWLVARNYSVRFTATLHLSGESFDLTGVYLCVENAMLPLGNNEILGYAHGITSIYDANQVQVFAGPFMNPVVGMKWQNGTVSDYWTQVVGTWAGENTFAGRLLQVNLQGSWDDQQRLVEEGNVTLI